ncbi:glycosyltransferase family 4 protein [Micromonospora sp. CPCC 206061]|uniref:glycosyltransferase family 4 protein n=1 Tax=Micromonospora sp. CPCC 206061 TaxID=3122410 RepID=UPI002FF39DDF
MRGVYAILPGGVDDLAAPSGGNRYDRRVCAGLAATGWRVTELHVDGDWPAPSKTARARLASTLAAVPDGAPVLIDGLVACGAPDVVEPAARRVPLAVLVHLPLADETGLPADAAARLDALERRTLSAATAVIATSAWTAARLVEHHGLAPDRVHVAAPGVDPAPFADATEAGGRLLCVAALTPRKAQDVLVEALATLSDTEWTCTFAGALDRDAAFTSRVRRLVEAHDLDGRARFAGPLAGAALDAAYAAADLLVLPSHAETYGMVVTEALARGVPVLATAVGGVAEALGPAERAPDSRALGQAGLGVPGKLVPPGDPAALAAALRSWLTDAGLRQRLRAAARVRRDTLPSWDATVHAVAGALERMG